MLLQLCDSGQATGGLAKGAIRTLQWSWAGMWLIVFSSRGCCDQAVGEHQHCQFIYPLRPSVSEHWTCC